MFVFFFLVVSLFFASLVFIIYYWRHKINCIEFYAPKVSRQRVSGRKSLELKHRRRRLKGTGINFSSANLNFKLQGLKGEKIRRKKRPNKSCTFRQKGIKHSSNVTIGGKSLGDGMFEGIRKMFFNKKREMNWCLA